MTRQASDPFRGQPHPHPFPPAPNLLLERLAAIAGLIVSGVGISVLLGWVLGLDSLKSLFPGLATMKANTALCFACAGAALVLRDRPPLTNALARVVLTVAGLTLFQYATGADLGLDQLLFRDTTDSHTIYPGRMAEATALGFASIGGALLLLRTQGARVLQQALTGFAGVIGMIATLGYAYNMQQLYRFSGFSSMALHSAASFVLLASGCLVARPDGLARLLVSQTPASQLARRLLPVAFLMPPMVGWVIIRAQDDGLIGAGMDEAVLALTMTLSLAAVIYWTADALNQSDVKRRSTEAELENRVALMNHAYEPLIVRELGGTILFWNQGAEAFYGWSAAEAVGRDKRTLLNCEGPAMGEVDRQLQETGHWMGEFVRTARDGRRLVIDSRQTATRTGDGRLLILESDHDITEQRRGEERLKESALELKTAYQELEDSRRAAINLLEDALEAREQAEAAVGALRQSEERLRTISDQIPGGAIYQHLQGPDGKVHYPYVSAGVERLFGLTPQEVMADPDRFLELVVEEDRARVAEATAQSARDLTPFDCEFRQRTVTGETRWVQCRSMPRPLTDGSIAWDGTVMDITARRQAEEGLRRYEILAKHSRDVILFMDSRSGRILEVNKAALDCYGYCREELLRLSISELRAESTKELTELQMAEAATHGILFETVHRRKDGSTFPVEVSSQGATVGETATLISVIRDITDRKQAEEELEKLSEQRKLALDAARMGWWHYDPVTRISSWDEGYQKIFGVSGYQRPNEEILARIHPDDLPGVWAKVEEALDPVNPRLYLAEYRINLPDGSQRWIEAHGVATFQGVGLDRQASSFVGTVADISDRKRAEEALQMAGRELERQVEERTRELREKEVLLKEIHHRVKNNLQVISSLVGMQADSSKDETVREVLREVTYRVRSMALVHEKLYHSADLARIDFAEYSRSLLAYLWRAHASTVPVDLHLELAPVSLPVDTAVPCGLILNELAGNALKHAFAGRDKGEVTVALRKAGTDRVTLSVRDNGVGLPPGFDWRQPKTLGLRLVSMLAGQLEGSVTVVNEKGVEFAMTFTYQGE